MACRMGNLDVLVNQLAVEHDFYESGVCRLMFLFVESRRAKNDLQRLPLARLFRGIHARGNALVDVVILGRIVLELRARINASSIAARQIGYSPRIADLNLIGPLQLDA